MKSSKDEKRSRHLITFHNSVLSVTRGNFSQLHLLSVGPSRHVKTLFKTKSGRRASCKSGGGRESTRVREGVGELREKRAQAREKEGYVERGEREGERMGVARENVSWPRSRVTTLRTAAPRPARFPPWRREDPPRISVPHYYSMCRSRRRGPSSRIRPSV